MHTPPAFRLDDAAAAFDLIAQDGFATLITVVDGALFVSHLPMLGELGRGALRGHLARANPHAGALDGRRHLAIFTGPDGYVSPDWYGDPEQVPTWNYSAVHVAGLARVLDEPPLIDGFLADLSEFHERRRHDLASGKIWTLAKLPPEKLRRLRNGIVAFEISIESIEMQAKLSQNKSGADIGAVIAKLAAGDERRRALAEAMRKANRAAL